MKKYILGFLLILLSFLKINAQNKDTLYFKLDKNYILISKYEKDKFYIKERSTNDSFVFHMIKKENLTVEKKKILNLKKFIRNSQAYKYQKIDDYELWNLFKNNYIVFFVIKSSDKIDYIQVEPKLGIE